MKKLVLLVVLMATSVFAAYMEMSWDNSVPYAWVEFSGTNQKMANDFALTDFTYEPERYGMIMYVRVYANLVGCGFNVSIEDESNKEVLWGPKEMIRYKGSRWYKIYVGYKLPDPYMRFKAVLTPVSISGETPKAFVDSHCETFWKHSWQHNGTKWIYLKGVTEGKNRYRNLMIRVRVWDRRIAVEPTSLGRIKALLK